jgi:hypothetical protein
VQISKLVRSECPLSRCPWPHLEHILWGGYDYHRHPIIDVHHIAVVQLRAAWQRDNQLAIAVRADAPVSPFAVIRCQFELIHRLDPGIEIAEIPEYLGDYRNVGRHYEPRLRRPVQRR